MQPENPVELRILLGFLQAGRVLDGGSSALLLGTLVLAWGPAPGLLLATSLGAALGLGLLAKYLAWRVALDAAFFAILHEQPQQAAAFDAALATFLGRQTPVLPRSIVSRWQGGRRLVWQQAGAVALQAAAVAAVIAARWWT